MELGKKVKASPQTIANWKKMPEWTQVAAVPVPPKPIQEAAAPVPPEPVKEAPVPQSLPCREVTTVDIEAIIAPQDLVALNDRLRSMLNREYLTTEDLEHLSNAKLTLLEAADVFLGMLEDAGHED